MDDAIDILVVGAGPVGLAAAVELKRRGFEPRIIDRDDGPTPADQSRALGVLPTTLETLAPSGITTRMLGEGLRIDRFQILRDGAPLLTLRTGRARTRYPFILSLPQGRTERLMIDWLRERGVEIGWNTELVGLESMDAESRVTLADGRTLLARTVIGCDGHRSAVRRALGIEWSGEDYTASFALADVRFADPIDSSLVKADLRSAGGALAFIPLSRTIVRYVGLVPSTEALLAQIPDFEEVIWESEFHVSFRRAERMAARRCFLAGDAAHVHSPIGARGMNLGIWDVACLAHLLSEGRETEYEDMRLPVAQDIVSFTRTMTDLVRSRSRLADLGLRFAMPLAIRLPLAERRIVERLLGVDGPRPEWLDRPGKAGSEAPAA